jgi:hypothetical protein
MRVAISTHQEVMRATRSVLWSAQTASEETITEKLSKQV